ncbi:outer membrane receptor protein involved in Fe transport [Novosphingobium kunmingense]|uniref:Outer membrane receptor protein involved in Fe transport n=1 Tax=Novosphingobium kunmingense TaxID=1211806 RepID=A0A2N0H6J9_9SPHN|nr:TonB-dependent receptor [Novosphingobium kunmingense]PKB14573.1 outer membrane receptor protein involved in Fe transport [Novosphingobium kunmingense]
MHKFGFFVGAASIALVTGFAPSSAAAQVADTTATDSAVSDEVEAQDGGIVVTARRREESIVDVPIAISAFTSQTIADRGLNSVNAVAQQTPGLQFDRGATAGDIRPSLRGIALIEGRSNVAIIVDGIDVTGVSLNTTIGGGGSQTSTTLMDLERIEVVKGPQTVYFGRSAFAGAIQFVTKDPSFNLGGSIQAALGDFDRRELSATITGPIVDDTVAAKLTATYRNFGGFYTNPGNGMGLGGSEIWGVGGSVLVRSGGFKGKFSLSYLDEHSSPIGAYVIPRPNVTQFGVNKITADTFNEALVGISSNIDYAGNMAETLRGVANLSYDAGNGWTIDSITGINKVTSTDQYDFDTKTPNTPSGTALAGGLLNCLPGVCVGIGDFDGDLQQISEELRLSYDAGSMRFLLGGYYFDEAFKQLDYTRFVGSQAFVTGTRSGITPRLSTLDTKTYAGFGSIEADVTDALTLTGELRFNHEIIKASAATGFNILFQNGSTAITFRGQETFNSWLPRFSLKYKLSTEANLYASVAKGSKPGGFNVGQVIDSLRPFGQESVWTYELGAKGRLFDGALTFDASLYYSDWRDVQVTTICYGTASPFGPEAACPTATAVSLNYIVNADKARVKGAELGLVAKPLEGLTLTGNYAYADSKFVDFVARDVYPSPAGVTRQFGGNRMPLIPMHSLSGSIRVEEPVSETATGFVEFLARHRTSRYARFDNRVLIGAKTVADLQIGVKGESWTALFFVDNLFNDKTPEFTRYYGNFNPSTPNGEFIAAPAKRALGVRLSKSF